MVIEFISPSNKGRNRANFIEKRDMLLAAGVNFVEIDLTRGGEWRKLRVSQQCPANTVSAYRYTIRVPQEPGVTYLQPISTREILPVMSFPVREGEARVQLPLQVLIDLVYLNGRYEDEIDYAESLEPPLDEADAAWAKELIAARLLSSS